MWLYQVSNTCDVNHLTEERSSHLTGATILHNAQYTAMMLFDMIQFTDGARIPLMHHLLLYKQITDSSLQYQGIALEYPDSL
jgi:hypothetical protein